MSQSIIFPIFVECKNYTLDGEWHRIFDKLARNNYKQVNVSDARTIEIKGKNYSLPGDVISIFEFVRTEFKKQFNIRSLRDELKESVGEVLIIESWRDVKKKHIQRRLIAEFATRIISEEHETSKNSRRDKLCNKENMMDSTELEKKTQELYKFLMNGVNYKAISKDDVVMKDGKIGEIKSLKKVENSRCGWRLTTNIKLPAIPKNKVKKRCIINKKLKNYFKEVKEIKKTANDVV